MKKIIISSLAFAILGCSVGLFFVFRFKELPEETKIRDIEVDGYSVEFFLTADDELYIGGIHMDSLGLYDNTGFKWSFMYAVRELFGKTDKPVLFRKNVAQVFEASNGFLFTDNSGTLYYFGSDSDGKQIKVAEDVKCASSYNQHVYYITTDGDAYRKVLSEISAEKIGSNAVDIYTNGLVCRILCASGEIHQFDVSEINYACNHSSNINMILDVRNDYDNTYILTNSGKLTLHQWPTGITGDEKSVFYSPADNVILVDMNFDRLIYIDKDGILNSVLCCGTIMNIEPNKEIRLIRTDIVDIAVDDETEYILFSDGTYLNTGDIA